MQLIFVLIGLVAIVPLICNGNKVEKVEKKVKLLNEFEDLKEEEVKITCPATDKRYCGKSGKPCVTCTTQYKVVSNQCKFNGHACRAS
uniref:X1.C3.3 n=1 Tax=Schmidtea mediterranea TaxID=79327 RepID=V9XRS6_SCHMD|nr:X1.C3.3 [Schmidtea mediterranea]